MHQNMSSVQNPSANNLRKIHPSPPLRGVVLREERGWGGHFISSFNCLFRRNTRLFTDNGVSIIVSTVGNYYMKDANDPVFYKGEIQAIGAHRYHETMVFHSNPTDTLYHDADVSKEIQFESNWQLTNKIESDYDINNMHETVVNELTLRIQKGEFNH